MKKLALMFSFAISSYLYGEEKKLEFNDLELFLKNRNDGELFHSSSAYSADDEKIINAIPGGFWIMASKPNVINGLYDILSDEAKSEHWQKTAVALGMIASVEPETVDLNELTNFAKKLESEENLSKQKRLLILNVTYTAIGRYGGDDAFLFLKQRTSNEFWQDKLFEVPITHSSSMSSDTIHTPQTEAIFSLSFFRNDNAHGFLKTLLADSTLNTVPHIKERIEGAIRFIRIENNLHEDRLIISNLKDKYKESVLPESPEQELVEANLEPAKQEVAPEEQLSTFVQDFPNEAQENLLEQNPAEEQPGGFPWPIVGAVAVVAAIGGAAMMRKK